MIPVGPTLKTKRRQRSLLSVELLAMCVSKVLCQFLLNYSKLWPQTYEISGKTKSLDECALLLFATALVM